MVEAVATDEASPVRSGLHVAPHEVVDEPLPDPDVVGLGLPLVLTARATGAMRGRRLSASTMPSMLIRTWREVSLRDVRVATRESELPPLADPELEVLHRTEQRMLIALAGLRDLHAADVEVSSARPSAPGTR
ncbi:MAG: hypothetical protein KY457_10460 [Actinobacteria bacterium]|nr:hypothetical protein [Actinomycetota bacterium]